MVVEGRELRGNGREPRLDLNSAPLRDLAHLSHPPVERIEAIDDRRQRRSHHGPGVGLRVMTIADERLDLGKAGQQRREVDRLGRGCGLRDGPRRELADAADELAGAFLERRHPFGRRRLESLETLDERCRR